VSCPTRHARPSSIAVTAVICAAVALAPAVAFARGGGGHLARQREEALSLLFSVEPNLSQPAKGLRPRYRKFLLGQLHHRLVEAKADEGAAYLGGQHVDPRITVEGDEAKKIKREGERVIAMMNMTSVRSRRTDRKAIQRERAN
jgi:hypothetical protein